MTACTPDPLPGEKPITAGLWAGWCREHDRRRDQCTGGPAPVVLVERLPLAEDALIGMRAHLIELLCKAPELSTGPLGERRAAELLDRYVVEAGARQ